MMPLWFHDPNESMSYGRSVDMILLPFGLIGCAFGFYFLFLFAFGGW